MSAGGRAQTRARLLRRTALAAVALVLLALILFSSGHWLLGLIFAAAAVAAIWVFVQARNVR